MSIEACFRYYSQPLSNTFSFHSVPCQYDKLLCDPVSETNNYICPYQDYCKQHKASLNLLCDVYGPWIKVTLSETTSSIVVRSEHQYNKNDHARLSLRKHLYEILKGEQERSGPFCQQIGPEGTEEFGHYLGFVDLRLHFGASPIAMALLVPPRRLRHSRETYLIQGEYGPIFGAHAFLSTVYSMQDSSYGGAACAQACVIMVLSALSDRGARVAGPYTLTYLAYKDDVPPMIPITSDDPSCLAHNGSAQPLKAFGVGGLFPSKCLNLLNACGVSGYKLYIEGRTDTADWLLLRLVEAYILARYPVIVFVDSNTWFSEAIRKGEMDAELVEVGHAVVIIGIRSGTGLENASFVVHDPGAIPYDERLALNVLDAAWSYPQPNGQREDSSRLVFFLFSAEARIKRHAYECLSCLFSNSEDFEDFRECYGWTRNYRVSLVHRDDLHDTFFSEGVLSELLPNKAPIPHLFYWCIDATLSNGKRIVWMYSAETEDQEEQWKARVVIPIDGKPELIFGDTE